ncbi:right-handed parallel beta-helix repeat-containing protein [bacterium]|nr:right-handed parallel beta-helix repeat-containing protein [bacterium]
MKYSNCFFTVTIVSIILILMLVFAGCGNGGGDSSNNSSSETDSGDTIGGDDTTDDGTTDGDDTTDDGTTDGVDTTDTNTTATLVSIKIIPANAGVGINGTAQLAALGTYSDNSIKDITESVTWSSSSEETASISNNSDTKGLVMGLKTGAVSIGSTDPSTSIAAGNSTLTVMIPNSTLQTLYPNNGVNLNDYVKDDGTNSFDATDTPCDAATDTSCIHGGVMRSVEVTGKSSCTGLSGTDTLGVFQWTCDDGTDPVRMISTGFKENKGVADLIDFSTVQWKVISSVITFNDRTLAVSISSTWWSNSLVLNNDGSDGSDMGVGDVHVVTINPNAAYTIGADKTALVIKPGIFIDASADDGIISAGSRSFIWVEGTINSSENDYGVKLTGTKFSTLNNFTVTKSDLINIYLNNSNCNYLTGVSTAYSAIGLQLENSDYNTLDELSAFGNSENGLFLLTSNNNTVKNSTVSNNSTATSGSGIKLETSENNTLQDIAANENKKGINLTSNSNNNVLKAITTYRNEMGIALSTSSNNRLTDIISDNYDGVSISLFTSSENNILESITCRDKVCINLNQSSNNTVSSVSARYYGDTPSGGTYIVQIFLGKDNIINNVSASNYYYGIDLNLFASNNILSGIITRNGYNGIYFSESDNDNNSANNITSSNNPQRAGFETLTGFGIYFRDTDNNMFTGEIRVGNNDSENCSWDTTGGGGTNPGLDDITCVNNGSSDATLTTGIDLSASFVTGSNWELLATDDQIRNVLSLPTSSTSDWFEHTWSDASTSLAAHNAVEILDDDIGNDNGLCEFGETCLYTPNIGKYQGHGNLIDAGTILSGDDRVILKKYEINGY